ncbi:hypothetical protein QTI66_31760 [Variovorax sp. J22R133]|uniref:hypothetical protein n=1 Tax=Variovorax brevis TaxID=3053503 RepID=UPI002575A152|nr:hypothetical protein [Variovorax sp. J22R133]MDM0116716.1 hypothetical protein [Variovorax sp. J22R133]
MKSHVRSILFVVGWLTIRSCLADCTQLAWVRGPGVEWEKRVARSQSAPFNEEQHKFVLVNAKAMAESPRASLARMALGHTLNSMQSWAIYSFEESQRRANPEDEEIVTNLPSSLFDCIVRPESMLLLSDGLTNHHYMGVVSVSKSNVVVTDAFPEELFLVKGDNILDVKFEKQKLQSGLVVFNLEKKELLKLFKVAENLTTFSETKSLASQIKDSTTRVSILHNYLRNALLGRHYSTIEESIDLEEFSSRILEEAPVLSVSKLATLAAYCVFGCGDSVRNKILQRVRIEAPDSPRREQETLVSFAASHGLQELTEEVGAYLIFRKRQDLLTLFLPIAEVRLKQSFRIRGMRNAYFYYYDQDHFLAHTKELDLDIKKYMVKTYGPSYDYATLRLRAGRTILFDVPNEVRREILVREAEYLDARRSPELVDPATSLSLEIGDSRGYRYLWRYERREGQFEPALVHLARSYRLAANAHSDKEISVVTEDLKEFLAEHPEYRHELPRDLKILLMVDGATR